MATEKITITDQLRNNIIEERKELEYTASDLSEESGHSKYWLANIESGKTKKISKEDLISIYKILLDDDDEENILDYIERIINQPIAGKIKNWYELIDIEDQYEDMMDFLYLESELDDLLKDIQNRITKQFNWANTHHQQAILTSLLHFQRSIVVNPELAFSTLYLPTYCTSIMHPEEFNSVLSDLLQLAAKFNDLVVKNNSLETVAVYLDEEKKQIERNKKTGKIALDNFKSILGVVANLKGMPDPDLESLRNLFYSSVVFLINEIQPNTVGDGIPYLPQIDTGKAFSHLVTICYYWLSDRQEELALPNVEKYIPKDLYNSAKEVLENVSKINDPV
ncbi:helix-turn-helix domain-containing protein [Blautia glucerasea]|uniref:helix-turn-helix domain-containing protein n=1 Tax=Blautia glucerasea TaxID=536633 RepID=UPI00156D5EFF|nr:helix-turn-helix transcriptional regulator [Blautia glucerasea]NSL04416.1 helix-turn-helix transcriptional regulator [Blautia glucerasea]